MSQLFHYCSTEAHERIQRTADDRPKNEGLFRLVTGEDGLVWATDLRVGMHRPLGVKREATAHRYRIVSHALFMPWRDWRHRIDEELVFQLELTEGAQPSRWYVAGQPVIVTYDPI